MYPLEMAVPHWDILPATVAIPCITISCHVYHITSLYGSGSGIQAITSANG